MNRPIHDALEGTKAPWGSKEMETFLGKIGLKRGDAGAMSIVMQLDDASRLGKTGDMVSICRELAVLRVTGASDGVPSAEQEATVGKLTQALLKQHKVIDAKFQKDQGSTQGQKVSIDPFSSEQDERFKALIEKAQIKASDVYSSDGREASIKFLSSFAKSSIKAGFWDTSEKQLVLPMLKAAEAASKKTASEADQDAGEAEDVGGAPDEGDMFNWEMYKKADAQKVDFGALIKINNVSGDLEEDVKSITEEVIKNGPDSPKVTKSIKNLMAKSAQQGKVIKEKKPRVFAFGLLQAVGLGKAKKKVTKPIKASDIPG